MMDKEQKKRIKEKFAKAGSEALHIDDVSGFLVYDEEIRKAADEWVFEKNGLKWSNNDDSVGDNYGSFIAGAKYVLSIVGRSEQ